MAEAKEKKGEKKTAAGRPVKLVEPGAAEPFDVDPEEFDPRSAPAGSPIAFPDPDEPYPGPPDTPYPPPADSRASKALNPDGTAKEAKETGGTTAAASKAGQTAKRAEA